MTRDISSNKRRHIVILPTPPRVRAEAVMDCRSDASPTCTIIYWCNHILTPIYSRMAHTREGKSKERRESESHGSRRHDLR